MAGWHHQLNAHEFEQALGNSEGQGNLVCYSSQCHKELDMTWRLNSNNTSILYKRNRIGCSGNGIVYLFILLCQVLGAAQRI